MHNSYPDVITRFLRKDERLVLSNENEMPLVIEAKNDTRIQFLHGFLANHSSQLLEDVATYGAVLFRGFDVASDEDFEKTILSIDGLNGISDAFMSEEGRTHTGNLNYVLHTNAVYKTGGTVYLGGFHSENYYGPDVPAYLAFCCHQPSERGGETGLINMEKIYPHLDNQLKEKLEKQSFFVCKWLVSEVSQRYKLSTETIEKICNHFDLPIVGHGKDKFILLYKPSVFEHPQTKKKAMQINLFELLPLNAELRKCFMNDYPGKSWFWHRFVWKLPAVVLSIIETIFIMFTSFFHSPKDALAILMNKIKTHQASKKKASYNDVKVGSCFSDSDIKDLAKLMRDYYSSCLWKKGDVLLIDNRKVVHAGMPGAGPRLVRAMICNPLAMHYSFKEPGTLACGNRSTESIGHYMTTGTIPIKTKQKYNTAAPSESLMK